jgi:DNA polymerase III sliding clamp (beta) subunit (PCNA family)
MALEESGATEAAQAASFAITAPSRGFKGLGVGLERLATGSAFEDAIYRASEATEPDFVPQEGEKAGAVIGAMVGDLPLFAGLTAIAAPAASAAVSSVIARSAVQAGFGSGIIQGLNDMAARGEVDPADVALATGSGLVVGAGVQAGSDAYRRLAPIVAKRIQTELNTLLFRTKRGLGIPQETGLVPFDLKKAVSEGRISVADAARHSQAIYDEALAIRMPGAGRPSAARVPSTTTPATAPPAAVKMPIEPEAPPVVPAAELPPSVPQETIEVPPQVIGEPIVSKTEILPMPKVAPRPKAKPTPDIRKPEKIADWQTTVKRAISKKTTLPILRNFRVEKGMAFATDLDVEIVKKSDLPDGVYEFVGKDMVKTADDPAEFPVARPKGTPAGSMQKTDLIAAMDNAAIYASTDETRNAIHAVNLEVSESGARIVATDGRRLAIFPVKHEGIPVGTYLISKPSQVASGLRGISGERVSVSLISSEQSGGKEGPSAVAIRFSGSDGSVATRIEDATYPTYKPLFGEMNTVISVDRKALEEAAKLLLPYTARSGLAGVEVRRSGSGLELSAGTNPKKVVSIPATIKAVKYRAAESGGLIMPLRGVDEVKDGFLMSLNLTFLRDVARTISGDTVFLGYGSPTTPLLFSETDPSLTPAKGKATGTSAPEPKARRGRSKSDSLEKIQDDFEERVRPLLSVPDAKVTSAIDISDSPLAEGSPIVPAGTVGEVQDIDYASQMILVDFKNGAGPILVDPDELMETQTAPGKRMPKDPQGFGTEAYDREAPTETEAMSSGSWQVNLPKEAAINERINRLQMMEFVEKEFGVPVRGKETHSFSKKEGHFEKRADLIRLKRWGEIEVLTHETAHHVDQELSKRLGIRWKSAIAKAGSPSAKMAMKELSGLDYKPDRGEIKEGFAEYVRHWITTGQAQELAPNWHAAFSKFLTTEPDLAAKMAKFRGMYGVWKQQGAEARVLSQIDFSGEIARSRGYSDKAVESMDWLKTHFVDEFWMIQKTEEALGHTSRTQVRPTQSAFEMATFVKQKSRGIARTFVEKAAVDEWGNVVGPSLMEVLAPIAYADMPRFIAYAAARRAALLASRNIESGFDIGDVNYLIRKNSNPVWDKVVDDITAWSDHGIAWIVRAGGLTPEEANHLRALNPVYLPFKRVFVDEMDRATAGGSKVMTASNAVKRIKGSARPIVNPMESLIDGMARMISAAHKIRVANLIADWADLPGAGKFIVEVPAPLEAKILSVDTITALLEEKGLGVFDLEGNKATTETDGLLTVFSNGFQYKGKGNVVAVIRGGERKFYELSPDLFRALQGVDEIRLGPAMRVMALFARTLRLGATGIKASFGLIRNPFRDTQTYLSFTKNKSTFSVFDPYRGIYRDLTTVPGEVPFRFKAAGGEIATQVGYDRASVMAIYDEILQEKRSFGKVLRVVKHPIDALRQLIQVPELGPRIGELERSYERYRKEHPDWSESDIFVAAFNDAQDITVNFTRSGVWGKKINQATAFFNANMQGLSKIARVIEDDPTGFVVRGMTYITPLALGTWYANKDKQWYKNLPPEYKYSNFFFEVGEQVIRLPMAFEVGTIFAALPVALADAMYKENAKEIDSLMTILASQTPPVVPTAFGPLIDVMRNKDFLGRPIESEGMRSLPATERFHEHTLRIAKALSRGFSAVGAEVSPLQVEHVLQSYTGGIARQFKIAGIKEPSDWPILGDILLRAPDVPRRQINQFFQDRKDLMEKDAAGTLTEDEDDRLNDVKAIYKNVWTPHRKALKDLLERDDRSGIRSEYKILGQQLKQEGYK